MNRVSEASLRCRQLAERTEELPAAVVEIVAAADRGSPVRLRRLSDRLSAALRDFSEVAKAVSGRDAGRPAHQGLTRKMSGRTSSSGVERQWRTRIW